jgi:hypothetical protein
MKVFITAAALLIVFSAFHVFGAGMTEYEHAQAATKSAANNCARAAALYFDKELYSRGFKVFNKTQSNAAALHVLKDSLSLTDDMRYTFPAGARGNICSYTIRYFDDTGAMTVYKNGALESNGTVSFPYLFKEPVTGFEKNITEADVIVTLDAGTFDMKPAFAGNPRLIRTSSYEQVGR